MGEILHKYHSMIMACRCATAGMDLPRPFNLSAHIQKERGFTLIEMIVVIAVMLVVLSISFTAFVNMLSSSEIEGMGKRITGVINSAKQQAVFDKINMLVVLDRKVNTVRAYKDYNSNDKVDAGDEEITGNAIYLGAKVKLHKGPENIVLEKVGYAHFAPEYPDVYTPDFNKYYDEQEGDFFGDVGDIILITADGQEKLCMDFDARRGIVRSVRMVK